MPNIVPDVDRLLSVAADDPRRFAIKSGRVGAYALDVRTRERIDLEVRHAEVVQKKREKLVDDDDELWITGTASSTVTDRDGDVLDANCQAKMLAQAAGLTMWLNHDYSIPESILGTSVNPTLTQRAAASGTVMDLGINVQVDHENPRAVKSWRHVAVSGTKLGFSIGGIFTDVDLIDDDDFWFSGLVVHDLDLVEISMVGVPSNPRAYTEFVPEMTLGFKYNFADAAKRIGNGGRLSTASKGYIRKSLLRGIRPEEITVPASVPLSAYDQFIPESKAAGNREDAAADPNQQTVVENPNATPTRDRPVMPEQSANPQRHPNVGPPNSDEPLAVPQHGTPPVVGNNQPPESNVVSIDNSAPAPARHHGSEEDGRQGTTDQLPSRPEQHAEMGRRDAAAGAEASLDQPGANAAPESAKPSDAKPAAQAPATAPAPAAKPAEPEKPSNAAKPPVAPAKGDDTKAIVELITGKIVTMDDVQAIVKDALSDTEGDSEESAAITDDASRVHAKSIKAMRAIVRSASHGVCETGHHNLKRAHSAIKSLLPDNYDIPDDALYPSYNTAALSASVPDTRALSDLQAKAAQLDADIAAKTAESKRLDDELARKQATPLGRRSITQPSGSTGNGSKPTLSLASYYKSTVELESQLNDRVSSGGLQLSARDASA